jgi:hypothetical protein
VTITEEGGRRYVVLSETEARHIASMVSMGLAFTRSNNDTRGAVQRVMTKRDHRYCGAALLGLLDIKHPDQFKALPQPQFSERMTVAVEECARFVAELLEFDSLVAECDKECKEMGHDHEHDDDDDADPRDDREEWQRS